MYRTYKLCRDELKLKRDVIWLNHMIQKFTVLTHKEYIIYCNTYEKEGTLFVDDAKVFCLNSLRIRSSSVDQVKNLSPPPPPPTHTSPE